MLIVWLGFYKMTELQYLNRMAGGAIDNIELKFIARDVLLQIVWNLAVALLIFLGK